MENCLTTKLKETIVSDILPPSNSISLYDYAKTSGISKIMLAGMKSAITIQVKIKGVYLENVATDAVIPDTNGVVTLSVARGVELNAVIKPIENYEGTRYCYILDRDEIKELRLTQFVDIEEPLHFYTSPTELKVIHITNSSFWNSCDISCLANYKNLYWIYFNETTGIIGDIKQLLNNWAANNKTVDVEMFVIP